MQKEVIDHKAIEILERQSTEFKDSMRGISKDMRVVAESNAIDPAFVVRCGEQTASIVTEMLATVKALAKQDQKSLENMVKQGQQTITDLSNPKGKTGPADTKVSGNPNSFSNEQARSNAKKAVSGPPKNVAPLATAISKKLKLEGELAKSFKERFAQVAENHAALEKIKALTPDERDQLAEKLALTKQLKENDPDEIAGCDDHIDEALSECFKAAGLSAGVS